MGAGNHYVDLFAGDDDHLPVGCHFGLRGFGHRTASGFLALHAGKDFYEHAPEGEMDSPLILFPIDSERGQADIAAMPLAAELAGRRIELRGGAADEVLGAPEDAVQILHRRDPMGVGMAGLDTSDPYKD